MKAGPRARHFPARPETTTERGSQTRGIPATLPQPAVDGRRREHGANTDSSGWGEAPLEFTSLPTVTVCLDGRGLVAAFEPDHHEHRRRSSLDVGAVTSRPVLHGLWLLPAGIPVPSEAIAPLKRRRLRDARHFALERGTTFERLYSPPGAVRAVAFRGTKPTRCVEAAVRFTPIVERIIITSANVPASPSDLSVASEYGIGMIEATEQETRVVLPPKNAVIGVPAVYRWWLAEIAYEGWLQQNAQPVS